jgi:hypothetical protein
MDVFVIRKYIPCIRVLALPVYVDLQERIGLQNTQLLHINKRKYYERGGCV